MDAYRCIRLDEQHDDDDTIDAVDSYMALRLAFVLGMGWLDHLESDVDSYDLSARTLYCIRRAADEANRQRPGAAVPPPRHGGVGLATRPVTRSRLAAGMRMTRVDSVEESLTWSMFGAGSARAQRIHATAAAAIADLDTAARESAAGLWDITRLVTPLDGSVSGPELIRSIYELIGMAVYATVIEPDADPAWLFLTTKEVKRLFDASGIGCEVIYAGPVTDTDDRESFLCMTRPRGAYERMSASDNPTHRRAFTRVVDGCDALRGRQLALAGR